MAKSAGMLKKHTTAMKSPEEILQKYTILGSCTAPSNNIYLSVFVVLIPKPKPVPGITHLLAGCPVVGIMNGQVFGLQMENGTRLITVSEQSWHIL